MAAHERVEGRLGMSSLGTAAAATKSLHKIIDDLYEQASRHVKRRIGGWRAEDRIRTLYKHIREIRKVKTIWQLDKSVDLTRFYYPARLVVDEKIRLVRSIADLPDGNIVIEGTGGLGKSIFLRYLTSRELYRGAVIPLFIELKRVPAGMRIIDYALEELSRYGISANRETLEFCVGRGSIAFLLDAFDEVKEADRAAHVDELEGLARKYPLTRIVVTARPGSPIAASTSFDCYSLAELSSDDIPNVVRKFVEADEANLVLESLDEAGSNIVDLLRTPLLVSLMVFRFRIDQSIPESIALFYEDIFDVMLRRHDRSKPGGGVDRTRTCGLGDATMRKVFNAFCYRTARKEAQVMTLQEAWDFASEAIAESDADAEPSAWIDDICSITCLLIEEAGEVRFLHKTVQEYHAATFVRGVSDARAARFYASMKSQWPDWYQTLVFLEEIDRQRFLVGFGLRELERAWGCKSGSQETTVFGIIESYPTHLVRRSNNEDGVAVLFIGLGRYWFRRATHFGGSYSNDVRPGHKCYRAMGELVGETTGIKLTLEMDLASIGQYVVDQFEKQVIGRYINQPLLDIAEEVAAYLAKNDEDMI